MNNKEATKALLEGKTLRRIEVPYFTYRFNFLNLSIDSTSGQEVTMSSFPDNATWEEVKEPFKTELIINRDNPSYYTRISTHGWPQGKFKITVEEVID